MTTIGGLLPLGDCGSSSLCDEPACWPHGAVRAIELTGALALARFERSALLTVEQFDPLEEAALVYASLGVKMDAVVESLTSRYERCEMAWVFEESPEQGRPHVHLLQWGSDLRVGTLRAASREAGLGLHVDIQPRDKTPLALARYVMKVPLSAYKANRSAGGAVLRYAADLNGGAFVKTTPTFWRLGKTSVSEAEARAEGFDRHSAAIADWIFSGALSSKMPPTVRALLGDDSGPVAATVAKPVHHEASTAAKRPQRDDYSDPGEVRCTCQEDRRSGRAPDSRTAKFLCPFHARSLAWWTMRAIDLIPLEFAGTATVAAGPDDATEASVLRSAMRRMVANASELGFTSKVAWVIRPMDRRPTARFFGWGGNLPQSVLGAAASGTAIDSLTSGKSMTTSRRIAEQALEVPLALYRHDVTHGKARRLLDINFTLNGPRLIETRHGFWVIAGVKLKGPGHARRVAWALSRGYEIDFRGRIIW